MRKFYKCHIVNGHRSFLWKLWQIIVGGVVGNSNWFPIFPATNDRDQWLNVNSVTTYIWLVSTAAPLLYWQHTAPSAPLSGRILNRESNSRNYQHCSTAVILLESSPLYCFHHIFREYPWGKLKQPSPMCHLVSWLRQLGTRKWFWIWFE